MPTTQQVREPEVIVAPGLQGAGAPGKTEAQSRGETRRRTEGTWETGLNIGQAAQFIYAGSVRLGRPRCLVEISIYVRFI